MVTEGGIAYDLRKRTAAAHDLGFGLLDRGGQIAQSAVSRWRRGRLWRE